MVRLLKTWSERKGATPAQLSLAWLAAHKPWIVTIPGTTQISHLEENIASADVKFSADELKQFNQELGGITIKGLRLPQTVLNFSNVEAPIK